MITHVHVTTAINRPALLIAVASPELSIEALTIVMGNNNDMQLLALNAAAALDMGGERTAGVPIYKGASDPLAEVRLYVPACMLVGWLVG